MECFHHFKFFELRGWRREGYLVYWQYEIGEQRLYKKRCGEIRGYKLRLEDTRQDKMQAGILVYNLCILVHSTYMIVLCIFLHSFRKPLNPAIIASHETIFESCILLNLPWVLCILPHISYVYGLF